METTVIDRSLTSKLLKAYHHSKVQIEESSHACFETVLFLEFCKMPFFTIFRFLYTASKKSLPLICSNVFLRPKCANFQQSISLNTSCGEEFLQSFPIYVIYYFHKFSRSSYQLLVFYFITLGASIMHIQY